MARIRTIKPDFFASDTVSELSFRARLTWVGLWTFSDDFGRCRRNVKLIKAAVWPLDEVSLAQIEKDLSDLEEARVIFRYTCQGKAYLQVTNWDEHQKVSHPTASKIPVPPDGTAGPPPAGGETPEDSGAAPEDSGAAPDSSGLFPPGIRKGNREKEKEKEGARAPGEPDRFAEFWNTYPRPVDKRATERAWRAALKRDGVSPGLLIDAARRYAKAKLGTEPKFIKHSTSWLNAGSYDNPTEPLRLVSGGNQGGYRPFQNPSDPSVYDEPLLPPNPSPEEL